MRQTSVLFLIILTLVSYVPMAFGATPSGSCTRRDAIQALKRGKLQLVFDAEKVPEPLRAQSSGALQYAGLAPGISLSYFASQNSADGELVIRCLDSQGKVLTYRSVERSRAVPTGTEISEEARAPLERAVASLLPHCLLGEDVPDEVVRLACAIKVPTIVDRPDSFTSGRRLLFAVAKIHSDLSVGELQLRVMKVSGVVFEGDRFSRGECGDTPVVRRVKEYVLVLPEVLPSACDEALRSLASPESVILKGSARTDPSSDVQMFHVVQFCRPGGSFEEFERMVRGLKEPYC
jgi:hypothetical protein